MARCPVALADIWNRFLALHTARSSSGFGPNPLSHTEIDAYARLHGIRFSATELLLLRTFDQTYLTHFSSLVSPNATAAPPP